MLSEIISTSLILYIVGGTLIISDIVIPSGGILSATGISIIGLGISNYFDVPLMWMIILFIPTWALSMYFCYKVMSKGGGILEKLVLPDKIKSNFEGIVGKSGVIYSTNERGNNVRVMVNGDYWICKTDGSFVEGQEIIVSGLNENELIIKKKEE